MKDLKYKFKDTLKKTTFLRNGKKDLFMVYLFELLLLLLFVFFYDLIYPLIA